jgi:DNA-binding Lrp family transcriptional regulator
MNHQKLRLAILKELQKGNKNITHEDLNLSREEFLELLQFLVDEGLIRDVDFYLDQTADLNSAQITLKGEQYLSDNSLIIKTYRGLKEVRDWLKL